MTDFVFNVVVPLADDSTTTAALGVNGSTPLTDKDLGKAVKLAGNNNYVVCSDGDDIEGVVLSVEPFTVNSGYGFGTVQTKERFVAKNSNADNSNGPLAVGDFVVAAAQPAVGTAITAISSGNQTGVKPTPVKTGSGTNFKWRVISLLGGTGAVNSSVLIERV